MLENNSIIQIESKEQIFLIINEIRKVIGHDQFVRTKVFNNILKVFDDEYKKFYIVIHTDINNVELKCIRENNSYYLDRNYNKDYKLINATELVRDIKLTQLIHK